MKVTSLTSEGNPPLSNPTQRDVNAAIDRLDGQSSTMVTLGAGDGDHHMGIGGGPDRFVVYMTRDNMSFSNLRNAAAGSETVMLNCGGQIGDYRAHQCVDRAAARAAAAFFCETGEANPELDWQHD